MNVHDSEKMMALMEECEYESVRDEKRADVIILNTCSIREKAAQKVFSHLGRLRTWKKNKKGRIIGVAGCLAQHLGERIIERAPFVDFVLGTHNIHKLPDVVKSVEKTGLAAIETSFYERVESLNTVTMPVNGSVSAYVTIMQGCNNFCAYCVVPYVRGREESRKFEDVLAEVHMLSQRGVKEITLLGQNVNSYGNHDRQGKDFVDLLCEIGKIPGIERIRFTTSHPKDIPERLIECFSKVKSLCEHIHLPVQSGSNAILKKMNRHYTAEDYIAITEKLREVCPGISITSDIIVGFPGETDEDFQATLALMERVRFDGVFSFKYSDREGTTAFFFEEKVPEHVKGERLRVLQLLQDAHTLEKHKAMIGRVEEVLVEGVSKNSRDDVCGRTRTNKIVNFRGDRSLMGKTVSVKITEAYLHSVRGIVLHNSGGGIC